MNSVAKVTDDSRSMVPSGALLPVDFSSPPAKIYRLAGADLRLRSESESLRQRFESIFGDCRISEPVGPTVDCLIRFADDGRKVIARFDDCQSFDLASFILALFSDRGGHIVPSDDSDWTWIAFNNGAIVGCNHNNLIAAVDTPWEGIFANTAVNRVLRLQSSFLFFHASAIGWGEHATMLVGPKASGKTTLSLVAAAVGCHVFSDEITGVDPISREVCGVRRAAGIRDSSRAFLPFDVASCSTPERYPDGTLRHNCKLNDIGNQSEPNNTFLRSIFFLNSFQSEAAAHKIENPADFLSRMLVLPVTLQSASTSTRLMQLMSLLSRTDCYLLDVGPPQQTISLVKQISGAQS